MKRLFVLCAFVLSALAAPASAAIVFNVDGAFAAQGTNAALGTLSGTFTTNDALTQVIGIDLTSSSNGAFQGFNYNNVGAVDWQGLTTGFRLTVSLPGSHTDQLQLVFAPALTSSGGTIGGNSFEHQDFQGSGNRILSGVATRAIAAVPEPATWLMMIGGFGMAGAILRRRRQTLVAA